MKGEFGGGGVQTIQDVSSGPHSAATVSFVSRLGRGSPICVIMMSINSITANVLDMELCCPAWGFAFKPGMKKNW